MCLFLTVCLTSFPALGFIEALQSFGKNMLMLPKAALEFPGWSVSFSPWLLLFPQFSLHPESGPWSGAREHYRRKCGRHPGCKDLPSLSVCPSSPLCLLFLLFWFLGLGLDNEETHTAYKLVPDTKIIFEVPSGGQVRTVFQWIDAEFSESHPPWAPRDLGHGRLSHTSPLPPPCWSPRHSAPCESASSPWRGWT